MLRTRVGYCGGQKASPTYYSLGGHTETIEIDFDPKVTSFEKMLSEFLASHDSCRSSASRQYRSVVFAHDEAQAAAAEKALADESQRRGREVATAIERDFRFWLAEDYHQKFRLRRIKDLDRELQRIYPELEDYVDSTVVTRLNAWAAGHGSPRGLGLTLEDLGLGPEFSESINSSFDF